MDAFSRFEQAGWAGKSDAYARLLGQITDRVVDPLLDAARVNTGTRVLDLACGPGAATARAAARGAAPVGVDLSPAMVALARQRYPALSFREASAEELPFAAGSFDAVVGNFLLHHLAEPSGVVAECTRVLDSGGRLALTAWNRPDRARFVGVLVDAIAEVGAPPPAGLPTGPPFFRYSEEAALLGLFESFAEVSVTEVAFEHRIGSVDELWDGLLDGTVRTSALVLSQPAPVRERIREAFDRLVAPYVRDDGLWLPVSAVLASGAKP
jgi:SAM-dependent methyltransferase